MEEKRHQSDEEQEVGRRRLSPSSQIGRMQQTGGTPESRRIDESSEPPDSETWRAPRDEDTPVERVKPRSDAPNQRDAQDGG